jgi:thiosulfate/3-mercaptopyruvate sulfurtransferase
MADTSNSNILVSTEWLANNLNQPGHQVVEVDVDSSAYDEGHIPGAVAWRWKQDLQNYPSRDIVTKENFEKLLGNSGIANDTLVILYGDNNNWFAANAYWILKYYGHEHVKIVDGGRKKWVDENRELTKEAPNVQTQTYKAQHPDPSLRAFRDYVYEIVNGDYNVGLVDVRSPQEYSGELLAPEHLPQEGSQRAGHIPGAQNIVWKEAVNDDGTFKSEDELRKLYEGKGITPDKEIITYCRIGERSAHSWFVLHELLGYPKVRNYDGSWTEWGSVIGAPIEK